MPKLLFLILVTFSVSGATSIPEDQNVQELASSEDSLVASDRACLDEMGWTYCNLIAQFNMCSLPGLGLRRCAATCGECCGNSHYPRCSEITTWQVCNIEALIHLCRKSC